MDNRRGPARSKPARIFLNSAGLCANDLQARGGPGCEQPGPGRGIGKVKAAAGHASLMTTSVYLHVVVDEREEVGELFGAGTW